MAIVTGWGAQVDDKKREEYGVSYVLGKPVDMNQLAKLIHEATGRRGAAV